MFPTKRKLDQLIRTQLQAGPPGHAYHRKMAPEHRHDSDLDKQPPAGARQAAVLVLLYLKQGQVTIAFMRRPPNSGPHSSQISFPGGQVEKTDPNLEHTALRETWEEFGIQPDSIDILGKLSQIFVAPSHFVVFPFAAWCSNEPDFKPDPTEVDEIIEIPARVFCETASQQRRCLDVRGQILNLPCYVWHDKIIWGATAMILSEFETILEKLPI